MKSLSGNTGKAESCLGLLGAVDLVWSVRNFVSLLL